MKKFGMKQVSVIVSVVVFSILLVAFIIILNFNSRKAPVDVLKEKTSVGLILNGSRNDRSWNSAHYEALLRTAGMLNIEVICREFVPEDENCYSTICSLIDDDDCRIVICSSYGYGEQIERAAAEYPDRYFLHASGTAYGKNLGSFFGRMYQFRYLSGIAAGLAAKNGVIGYVAAFPISEVNRGINAFTLGVRSVNPDASVHVRFCNSWNDDEPAADAAQALITECGAEVIAMHTNSLAPLKTADANGVWSVGYNFDNSELCPDTFLTGCVWEWDNYYYEQILSCLQGKFRGEHIWLGIESGTMELVDINPGVNDPEKYKKAVEAARALFENYSYDVFYGPVTDIGGRGRIGEGESMSDDRMLNKFDWYVEGVEIEQ